jgi:pyruvate/2-oxoglutarate/acetoin dehydrogenase E1 component
MKNLSMVDALGEAVVEEMTRDGRIVYYGEDVAVQSNWGISVKTWKKFGNLDVNQSRVLDTSISETAIVGSAVGAAITGLRPIIEIMFVDFAGVAMDEIVNQAAKARYMFGGKAKVPVTMLMTCGGGQGAAAQHSQCLEAWFLHVPGLKVVAPSTPADAKALLKAAIRDDDPVIFLIHHMLMNVIGPVPDGETIFPLGTAKVKRTGKDVTVVATMAMIPKALSASKILAKEGIEVEVIDPCSLFPLDKKTILDSVRKTGRVVIAEEACRRGGFNAELSALIVDETFSNLKAAPIRIGALETPIPCNPVLESYVLPGENDIIQAIRKAFNH